MTTNQQTTELETDLADLINEELPKVKSLKEVLHLRKENKLSSQMLRETLDELEHYKKLIVVVKRKIHQINLLIISTDNLVVSIHNSGIKPVLNLNISNVLDKELVIFVNDLEKRKHSQHYKLNHYSQLRRNLSIKYKCLISLTNVTVGAFGDTTQLEWYLSNSPDVLENLIKMKIKEGNTK